MPTISNTATLIGEHLKAYRISRNDRQEDMAARIGVGLSTYRAMEKGDDSVRFSAWLQVVHLMNHETDLIKVFEHRAGGGLLAAVIQQKTESKSLKMRVRKRSA